MERLTYTKLVPYTMSLSLRFAMLYSRDNIFGEHRLTYVQLAPKRKNKFAHQGRSQGPGT